MKIAITGTLSKERKYFEDLLKEHGHELGGVSKSTDYLVIGDKPGNSKLNKAKEYDIETITEDELMELI